ncbi:MAG: molecular chaperone Hsp20 [Nitrospinaceae bacterium]|nr:MAG: molecular chaperone Hsp20 [Nitrospinaceae bacterium]
MNFKNLIPRINDDDKYLMESPFANMEREMNRMFRNFSRNFFDEASFGTDLMAPTAPMPKVDVTETDGEVQVVAELPGLDEKDVDVSLSENVLTLKGEKKHEKEEKQKNFYRMERTFGKFQRRIALPAEIESDKVEASFKKGILTVKLPKSEKAQKEAKKITIKS